MLTFILYIAFALANIALLEFVLWSTDHAD